MNTVQKFIVAAAIVVTAVLAGAASSAADTTSLSPNQPCPTSVRECLVVNCAVTPEQPGCPNTDEVEAQVCPPHCGDEPTTTTEPPVTVGPPIDAAVRTPAAATAVVAQIGLTG